MGRLRETERLYHICDAGDGGGEDDLSRMGQQDDAIAGTAGFGLGAGAPRLRSWIMASVSRMSFNHQLRNSRNMVTRIRAVQSLGCEIVLAQRYGRISNRRR